MSGIEVAGLALGAIPVLLEAIKTYRDAQDKIQTFKQSTKQLQIVDAQFRVCRLNFLNECRLLLDLILSNQELSKEMIRDVNHPLWEDKHVRLQFEDTLKEHVDACATIVLNTHSVVQELDTRLSKFQVSPKSSGALQRARTSATFVMEKSRFERDISSLRNRNADLNLLRTQLTALESRPKRSIRTEEIADLAHLSRLRIASDTLHDTLKQSWSCSDKSHIRHLVKLCIESNSVAKYNTITLDLAITYEMAKQTPTFQTPLIWLYVRADSTEVADARHQTHATQLQSFIQSLQYAPSPQNSPQHIFAPALSSATNIGMGPIRYASNPNLSASPLMSPVLSSGSNTISGPIPSSKETDICTIQNVCSYFQRNLQGPSSCPNSQCLGYMKSPTDSKYLFYPPTTPRLVSTTSSADEVTSLIAIIEQSQGGPSDLLHQYQLALKISNSVLQFHGTAWMQPTWKLRDVSIFGSELSDQTLMTLHLSTYFESSPQCSAPSSPSDISPSNPASQTTNISPVDACCASLCPGIYNETLFSLGIALLEIAHWQPLRSMGQNDANEFYTAHRLVRGRPPLGLKYRRIVERCLRCDFNAGTDLEDIELQQAVWSKVVFPLEALIRDTSQEV